MNGRKARALRRLANRTTVGMPARNLLFSAGYAVPVPTGRLDSMGKPIKRYVEVTGTAAHSPTCTRAVYKKLKRTYGQADIGALK